MKKQLLICLGLTTACTLMGADRTVNSPDGRLAVTISDDNGRLTYTVNYNNKTMLCPSQLGLRANYADFTRQLRITGARETRIDRHYDMTRIKKSHIHYTANQLTLDVQNADSMPLQVTVNVSNNDIAYRYTLPRPRKNNPKVAVVEAEAGSFNLPDNTTTFLCPQITPMTGWERTKPSYEEEYTPDAPMTAKSQYGVGYTFPCLFKVGNDGWVLVSETGVTGGYCGSRLSDYRPGQGYTIAYPQPGEANGVGSATAAIALPGNTPWRTITLGPTLAPIVETTIPYDVVEPLYEAKTTYKPGRYTWSWLIWQDGSINYDDQVQFIDLAAAMGYEYTLVDNWWDSNIGRSRMEELSAYARSKGVHLMLWYNSNGAENDAPQGPRNLMNNAISRKKEMAWLRKIGVAGIKVDFFAGDKQHTMQLYEDILSDANDYGLQVIFHGCTLPRGWERMYPNYVASEAALASENVYFTDYHAKREGFELSMHPFSRNAVGSFDWGGIIMNRYLSKDNKSRHARATTNTFELATAITNQTGVNCVAVQPNNLNELSTVELDFLRRIPTTWDDTRYIDGYPTRFAIIAREHAGQWFVGGINGTSQPISRALQLPMLAGKSVKYYFDRKDGTTACKTVKVDKDGRLKISMPPMGGFVLQ